MSKFAATTLLMAALAVHSVTFSATSSADWKQFRVTGEHFSVSLPALPVVIQRGQYGQMPIGIPPFGLPVRKAAHSYSAYADGVVYHLIYFANPKHEERLEFFLNEQLKQNELRNAEILTTNETSENGRRVLTADFKKYDFRKSFSYPGALKLVDDKDRAFALLAIGKDKSDAEVAQFLQSLEIADHPDGIDIGGGGTNASEVKESDDTITAPSTTSARAMIILKPEPSYTEAARRKQLRGSVTLKAVLSASGKVTNIEVISGLPDFVASSINAAGKMCFIPAIRDGHFVSTRVELQYNFNLY